MMIGLVGPVGCDSRSIGAAGTSFPSMTGWNAVSENCEA